MASLKILPTNKLPRLNEGERLAVAYSGGLDSTVLLHALTLHYGPDKVVALHVHHGLQVVADEWVKHGQAWCQSLGVEFDCRYVDWQVDISSMGNIEARARAMRYQYLEEMCVAHQITQLLMAHHEDDQAETLLLQLLRGSGIAGLAGMPMQKKIGDDGITFLRPLLQTPRVQLEEYAKVHALSWIEDPSNEDERYTRNFIRHQLAPLLQDIQPQFRRNLARSSMHFSRAQGLLDQLAEIDLENLQKTQNPNHELHDRSINPSHGIGVRSLLALFSKDIDRANNALRRWLALQGLLMPSEERLNAWWKDLQNLKDYQDQRLVWQHDGKNIRIWHDRLLVTDATVDGRWYFERVIEHSNVWGLADTMYQEALQNHLLQERTRSGGEKIRISLNTPRKTLKNIFQESGIPSWQRNAPLLYLGEELLAVAGVGMHCDLCVNEGVRWVAHFAHQST